MLNLRCLAVLAITAFVFAVQDTHLRTSAVEAEAAPATGARALANGDSDSCPCSCYGAHKCCLRLQQVFNAFLLLVSFCSYNCVLTPNAGRPMFFPFFFLPKLYVLFAQETTGMRIMVIFTLRVERTLVKSNG